MAKEIRNIGASVRARLQNLSRETSQNFELILTRYALERLLYRLSTSAYAERFVLKGAMLLTSWFADPHRATRDLDLLGFGDPSPDAMIAAFREILAADVADGVKFDLDALRVDQISLTTNLISALKGKAKSGIDECAYDGIAIFFRDTRAACGFVPCGFDLVLHSGDECVCLFAPEVKALTLREQVFGMRVAAPVTATQGKVAALQADQH